MAVQYTGFCHNSPKSLFSVRLFNTCQQVLVCCTIFLNRFSKLCPSFLLSLQVLAVPGEGPYCEKKHIIAPCCLYDTGPSPFTPLATDMNNRLPTTFLQLSYNSFCYVFIWINLPLLLFPIQTEILPTELLKQVFWKCWAFSSSKFNAFKVRHEPYVQNIFRKIWGNLSWEVFLLFGLTTAT